MSVDTSQGLTSAQVADKILTRLAEAEQPLPSALELFQKVIIAQSQVRLPDISGLMSSLKKRTAQHLAQGKPALSWRDLKIDWVEAHRLFLEVSHLAQEYLSPAPEEATALADIGRDLNRFQEAAKVWFSSKTAPGKSTGKGLDINPVVASVIEAAMHPFLAAYAHELLPLVNQESWHKGRCPICGGSPDFAFLDKQGKRWLMCSRCDSQWLFYRLACPFCNNQERSSLAYFADDNNRYRLYICEKCHRYIKAIDLRQAEADVLLPLERVLTLDMDRQADESGYRAE